MNQQNLADFIWNVADVLRGDFRQSIYGRIILPLGQPHGGPLSF